MPRDGSQTRIRLLDAAERLIETNGFAATSVDQILEASGSSKGAFFHHFESKRALAHALVARYVDADLAMLQDGLAAAEGVNDPVERLVAFLAFYENWSGDLTAEAACLYLAVVTERDLLDDQTADEVKRAIVGWRSSVAGLIQDAYDAAGVANGPDPDELADQLFVVFEGAYLVCRALGSPEPMRAQLRVFRQLVQSLLGR
jgi:TetR/AcrR family transcriptional regulator, transcriptional repressor for nem operon